MNTTQTEYLAALKACRRCKDGTINGNDAHRAYIKFRKILTDDEMCEVQQEVK